MRWPGVGPKVSRWRRWARPWACLAESEDGREWSLGAGERCVSVARGMGAATGQWRVQAGCLVMSLDIAVTHFLPRFVFLSREPMDLSRPATSRKSSRALQQKCIWVGKCYVSQGKAQFIFMCIFSVTFSTLPSIQLSLPLLLFFNLFVLFFSSANQGVK